MPKSRELIRIFKPYLFNIILLWLIIFFYRTNSYYVNFLKPETQTIFFYFAISYTIISFYYYVFLFKKSRESTKGLIVYNVFKKIIKESFVFLRSPSFKKIPRISPHQRTIILFIIVKVFFLPLMINFCVQNYFALKSQLGSFPEFLSLFSLVSFNTFLFGFLISVIFFLDTFYYAFGYLFEAKFLKNKIKSVEPTLMGWAVALICYPPFNSMFVRYVDWYPNIHYFFDNEILLFLMRFSVILLLSIYLGATFALGTKCSNLTNRGIVSRGPYRFVRHPAYISKNLSWWLVLIPVMSWAVVISMGIWSFVYHLRTITEERHLGHDPDYVEYCKKVKYRYIPYIY